jgi:hypothetical protein
MVVVCELRRVEEVRPIILPISAEHAEIRLQPFVIVLHLPLCFRMIGSRETWVDTKRPVQVLHVRGSELGPAVGVVGQWKPVQGPDVSDVEFG